MMLIYRQYTPFLLLALIHVSRYISIWQERLGAEWLKSSAFLKDSTIIPFPVSNAL
jgi:hypothetical protein